MVERDRRDIEDNRAASAVRVDSKSVVQLQKALDHLHGVCGKTLVKPRWIIMIMMQVVEAAAVFMGPEYELAGTRIVIQFLVSTAS